MPTPFDPPPGLNSDDTTFKAEGRWADGNNVRFWRGQGQTVGGRQDLFTISASGVVYSIFPFNRSGTITIAYGLNASSGGLWVGSGLGSPSDRSPALGVVPPNWSFGAWGSTLLACPEGASLYQQIGAGTATEVTQAPDAITYMIVTPQRQVLALGCNEELSGVFNPLCIRGSDLEDYTDWTTSATNNAFEHILDSGGAIVAARAIGDYLAVWTTSSLYLGHFIGDPGQTYRFDKVDENCGLVGPNAVVIFNQRAYWVGPDLRWRTWSVGVVPEIVPCPIFKQYSSGQYLPDSRYIALSSNARFSEIRADYRDGAGGYPVGSLANRYIAVCLDDGAWHRGAGGRTAIVESGLLASLTAGYTDGPSVIAATGSSSPTICIQETGPLRWGAGSNSALSPSIQSADFYTDNSRQRMMIRGIKPDFEDQVSAVYLTLCLRSYPEGAVVTKGPYTLTAGITDTYLVNGAPSSGSTNINAKQGQGGIAAGRQVTFSDVNEWAGGADTGSLARFTLTADYIGGNGTLAVTPAFNETGVARNITALPANNAIITVLGTQAKKDFRASGKIMSVKFAGPGAVSGSSSYFRLGKCLFDMVPMGGR